MATQIQLRRDTAANWTTANPTLAQGEPGVETDTGKMKVGDGATAWNSLTYQAAANIVDGTIVNADVNASAAIAGSKINPDFGAQNVTTTGNATAASLIPSSSTVPTNGVYLPSANTVGISTNGTGRLFVDSSGNVEIAGTGKRILGDFANATLANRLSFQSSGANLSTVVQAIPNGTATSGQFRVFNSSDPDNAGGARLIVSTTAIGLESVTSGTGTHLPINFSTGGSARLTILTDGKVGIGGTPSTDLHITSGSGARVRAGGATGSGFEFNDANTRLDIPAANSIAAYTNNTERARIDSSGRLLVGTSTSIPSQYSGEAKLQVANTGYYNLSCQQFSNDAFESIVVLGKSRSSSIGGHTIVQNGDSVGNIRFEGSDGTAFRNVAQIVAQVDGTPGANDMPGRLVFSTTADGASSPTERVRITSTGTVSINEPAGSGSGLFIKGVDSGTTQYVIYTANTNANYLLAVRNDGAFLTGVGPSSPYNLTTALAANVYVDASGVFYRSTSSARFKTDIETLQDTYADNILNCRPVWYRSTANADNPSWGWWGFIAEEVAEIDPRLVFWKTKETKLRDDYVQEEGKAPGPTDYVEVELETPIAEGVQYDRFVPHLVNLIKRQQQAIETLEAKVAALEGA